MPNNNALRMIDKLKKLIGLQPAANFKELLQNGALLIDVRTKQEYSSGHIKNSINIPLDSLSKEVTKLDKKKVVITCCQSGMRSGMAKGILKSQGFIVYNGGGWMNLKNKLQ